MGHKLTITQFFALLTVGLLIVAGTVVVFIQMRVKDMKRLFHVRWFVFLPLFFVVGCLSLEKGSLKKDLKISALEPVQQKKHHVRKEKKYPVEILEDAEIKDVVSVLCGGLGLGFVGDLSGKCGFSLNQKLSRSEILKLIDFLVSKSNSILEVNNKVCYFHPRPSSSSQRVYVFDARNEIDMSSFDKGTSAGQQLIRVGEKYIVRSDSFDYAEAVRRSLEAVRHLETYKLSYQVYEVVDEKQFEREIYPNYSENGISLMAGLVTPLNLYSLTVDRYGFLAKIHFLETRGYLESYSNPYSYAVEGVENIVKLGQSVPVIVQQSQQVNSANQVLNSVQYRDTGLMLITTVTYINEVENKINFRFENSSITSSGVLDNPIFSQDVFSSSCVSKKNSVLVIGGQTRLNRENRRGFGLKIFDLLGSFFVSRRDREILIVINIERMRLNREG